MLHDTFVRIPAGRFLMGGRPDDKFVSAVELPQREVNVGSFFIAWAPVTEGDWAFYCGKSIPDDPAFACLPVVNISWCDACDYTAWLSSRLNMICRLPTEAEWEYACRAGSEAIFTSGGDISPEVANYLYGESGLLIGPGHRTPVATYPANAFGLFDMAGNVCEWTADTWVPLCEDAPSAVSLESEKRAIRGGGWDHLPRLLRSSWRDWAPQEARYDNLGFRVAADLAFQ